MKNYFVKYTFLLFVFVFTNCKRSTTLPVDKTNSVKIIKLFDNSRKRAISVATYQQKIALKKAQKVVIISHGYSANQGTPFRDYSFLANRLAKEGYFVISIQHELPTDALIATTGNIYETRKPVWQRGVQNILFVIEVFKQSNPLLDFKNLALIGHSNGGDMSIILANQYPQLAQKVISLDNRRMPFPRNKEPKILSLRSTDQVADAGVLPTLEQQQQYGTQLIQLKNTKHGEMSDSGTQTQRQEINDLIVEFLLK